MNDTARPVEYFTREVMEDSPEWVAERRMEYLNYQIIDRCKKIFHWLQYYSNNPDDSWWNEAIAESVIAPLRAEIEKMEREIGHYQNPTPIDYNQRLTKSNVEEAKNTPISDVFNGQLVKRGRLMLGLCPFHADKTPSFVVYEDQNSWWCYGCNKGGDVISYVMIDQGLNFIESVKYLKDNYGF